METLTKDEEKLIEDFFNEVENRIPQASTYALNNQFWMLGAFFEIPPADRELLAASLIYGTSVKFSSSEIEEKTRSLLNSDISAFAFASIKTAAEEKVTIDNLRKRILAIDKDCLKNVLSNRLNDLLVKLPTSNSPFDINKINNLLDESPRLGFERSIFENLVKIVINADRLLYKFKTKDLSV